MRRLLCLASLALLVFTAIPLAAAEGLDYDLSRAYNLLDKGQNNRAKVIFRDYLRRHPRDAWARQGYEQAGGDLDALGLRPLAHADAADAAAARVVTKAEKEEAEDEDNTPRKQSADDEGESADGLSAKDKAELKRELDKAGDELKGDLEKAVREAGIDPATGEPLPAAASVEPSWGQRMKARLAGWGLWAKLFLLVLLGIALFIAFLIAGLRFSRWHAAKRQARVSELLATPGPNVYLDERRWAPWWGLGLDNETLNNDLIRQANLAGWRCREVQVAIPFGPFRLTFLQLLLVGLISGLTLGFMRYHVGSSLLFEREAVAG